MQELKKISAILRMAIMKQRICEKNRRGESHAGFAWPRAFLLILLPSSLRRAASSPHFIAEQQGSFRTLVQRNAVAVAVAAAGVNQPSRPAVLQVGHYGQFVFNMPVLLSGRTEKCPSRYHYFFQEKRWGLMKIHLYIPVHFWVIMPPLF